VTHPLKIAEQVTDFHL